ncbi:MAG: methyl-accepting chemotaxis protein, partial [Anaeromicrobium sp.]|uniref:cache domain-containing protein n=1 Tax=Anaeromicrobium sp. TaxID=1929132 RepID=UPI0025D6B075
MKKRGKVKNSLMIVLMIMVIIPLLALGFLTYNKTEDVLETNLILSSEDAIKVSNEQINDYLNNIESKVMIIANDETIYELLDNPSVEDEIHGRNALDNVKQSDEDLMYVYLASEDGSMYVQPKVELEYGFDPRTRQWYKDSVSNKGKILWTEPYIDDITGEYIISCTKALVKNDQVVGVVGIDLNLRTLSEYIANKTIGKDGYIYITDKDGTMISHKNKELIGKDDATKLECWDTIKNSKRDFITYKFQGEDKFAVFTTNEKMGWKIIGALNEDELSTDTGAIKTFILITIAVSQLLAIGVSVLVANGISKPLNSLKNTLNEVAEGNLGVRAETNRNDEFGEIEDACNHMIENIRGLIKGTQESSRVVLESSEAL